MTFFGRKKELKGLQELLIKKSASLCVIRGRRRIGKSRLIEEFSKSMRHIQFSGLPPHLGSDAKEQREEFASQMQAELDIPLPRADRWVDLLKILADHTGQGRVIIVLDEISWIGSKDPSFLGWLKYAWDMWLSKNPKLILILCGSVSSWIEKNIIMNTGFVGRISHNLVLKELPLKDAVLFWREGKDRISSYEKFKILAVMGGVPRYLEEIIPSKPAEENIKRTALSAQGLLFLEFDQIFYDIFNRKSETYRKIVSRLAKGSSTLHQIYEALGIKSSGVVSSYMNDLIQAGFVTRDYTWKITPSAYSRLSRYRLSDNYLRFYFRFILPNKQKILEETYAGPSTRDPNWLAVMGLQFENLVLNNRVSLCEKIGIPLGEIDYMGPFFQNKSKGHKGCQFDMLIQTHYKTLYPVEIKFSTQPIEHTVAIEMREKIKRITLPRGFSVRPVLVHVNGVRESLYEEELFNDIIDFGDLID